MSAAEQESEAAALLRLMDSLPIYATKIGFRYDSTTDERALGEDLFEVHRRWQELREARS